MRTTRVSQPRCGVSAPSFLDALISNGNTRLGTPAIFRQNELIGNRASLPSPNRKIDLARASSRHAAPRFFYRRSTRQHRYVSSVRSFSLFSSLFLLFSFFSFIVRNSFSPVEMCERNRVCQIDVRYIARILSIVVNTGGACANNSHKFATFPSLSIMILG